MLEDTRIGLSLLLSVAALAGVAMPLARAFLSIGAAICGEDFMQTGRTLAGLGLGALDRGALEKLLHEGFNTALTTSPASAPAAWVAALPSFSLMPGMR